MRGVGRFISGEGVQRALQAVNTLRRDLVETTIESTAESASRQIGRTVETSGGVRDVLQRTEEEVEEVSSIGSFFKRFTRASSEQGMLTVEEENGVENDSRRRLISPQDISGLTTGTTVFRRQLHIGAAGSIRKYDSEEVVSQIQEPAMVSTYESRESVLRDNPNLQSAERNLREAGHDIAYGIDLTKLADDSCSNVRDMMRRADSRGVDMSMLQVDYLRSPQETPTEDQSLIDRVLEAANNSGVETIVSTHAHSCFTESPLPNQSNYRLAADRTGYEFVGSEEVVPGLVETNMRSRSSVGASSLERKTEAYTVKKAERSTLVKRRQK